MSQDTPRSAGVAALRGLRLEGTADGLYRVVQGRGSSARTLVDRASFREFANLCGASGRTTLRQTAEREGFAWPARPGSQGCHVGWKTIQGWCYAWRCEGIAGLVRKARVDRGQRTRVAHANVPLLQRLIWSIGQLCQGGIDRISIHFWSDAAFLLPDLGHHERHRRLD